MEIHLQCQGEIVSIELRCHF